MLSNNDRWRCEAWLMAAIFRLLLIVADVAFVCGVATDEPFIKRRT